MISKRLLAPLALLPLALGCSDTTGSEGAAAVAVRFQAAAPGASASAASMSRTTVAGTVAEGPITLAGSNGVLVIEDIRLVVSEIELERLEGECLGDEDDACEEFEGGPFLVRLLDGSADDVVRALIPAGSYTELEFEVEDLDLDDGDTGEQEQARRSILAELRGTYPEFPAEASMVVRGTFDGAPFIVYFRAEIEVEREFDTPLRVPEDRIVLVTLSPEVWFRNGDQVLDLLALDGQIVEFEAEMENGIIEVEFDG